MRPGNPYGIFDTSPPGAAVATCWGQEYKALRAGQGKSGNLREPKAGGLSIGHITCVISTFLCSHRRSKVTKITGCHHNSGLTCRERTGGTLDPSSLASYVAVFTVFFAFLVAGDTGLATSLVAPEPVLDAVFVALRAARFGALRVAAGG